MVETYAASILEAASVSPFSRRRAFRRETSSAAASSVKVMDATFSTGVPEEMAFSTSWDIRYVFPGSQNSWDAFLRCQPAGEKGIFSAIRRSARIKVQEIRFDGDFIRRQTPGDK